MGAAIGAITAGIQGGDILKGALYGAVGGAVLGGIAGYLNPGAFGATAAGESMTTGAGEISTANGLVQTPNGQVLASSPEGQSLLAGQQSATNAVNTVPVQTGMSDVMANGLVQAGTGAVQSIGEGVAAGAAQEDMLAAQEAASVREAENRKEEMALANKYALEQIGARGGSGGNDALAVAESNQAHDIKMHDIAIEDADAARLRSQETMRGLKVGTNKDLSLDTEEKLV